MSNPLLHNISKSKHTLITILLIIFLCIVGFYTIHSSYIQTTDKNITSKKQLLKSEYYDRYVSLASNYTVANYLRSLTLHPHLAGTDQGQKTAQYVLTQFQKLGLEIKVVKYSVLLSYPISVSLTGSFSDLGSVELGSPELGRAGLGVVRPYHAYSPSGSVIGKAVFVNYGREKDYVALGELGVNVSGCVVVVRRGEDMSRGGVVSVASEYGALAVVMYTEGEFVKGVERGTVMKGLGDPLTPGWASVVDGGERLGRDDSEVIRRFPKIPSMPISMEKALLILRSLKGPQLPHGWRDTLLSDVVSVGPGPTLLNFSYQGEEKTVTIHDVFAIIRGIEESDRYILLGNHRDAWTYGAVDPNSGTATLLDVARRFAFLMRLGWSPQRTIIMCSWDAEEFGMVGSTEWVEQNLMNLGSRAVAYLNVDCAVQGPGLFARMTPQLDDLFIDVTKKVKDPDVEGSTVYEQWTSRNKGINIQRLIAADSDFSAFLHYAGVPSIDMYYGKDFPVYHTAFDSFEWMTTYGDPFFHRHVAVAGLWGLLALHLADDPILPFNYHTYAVHLQEYTSVLSNMLEGRASLQPMIVSAQNLLVAVKEVEEEAKKLRLSWASTDLEMLKKRMLNDRLMLAERGLLDVDGLQGHQWFRHLVYGPSSKYDSKISFTPRIANAIPQSAEVNTTESNVAIQHEIWRVARAIQRAADTLKGDLF